MAATDLTNYESQQFHISQNELDEAKDAFEKDGAKGCQEYFKQKLQEWKTVPFNIGIIGNTGQGKSTFINSVRRLTADDEGGAAVDVKQTTLEPTPYAHPDNQNLKFWDLPGLNTPEYTTESYFDKVKLPDLDYDFYLLMSCDRFKDDDKWLATEINNRGKKFFFVRTKVHQDVKNDRKDHPSTKGLPDQAERVLQRITDDIIKNLMKDANQEGKPVIHFERHQNVFLIDSHRHDKYDFSKLQESVIGTCSEIKREAFLRTLTGYSSTMLAGKKASLKKDAYWAALASGAVALAPIPGVSVVADVAMVVKISNQWYHSFGLDKESLEKTARETNTDIRELEKIVQTGNVVVFISVEGLTALLKEGSLFAGEAATEEIEIVRYFSLFGPYIASSMSAVRTYKRLVHILDRFHNTALKVVETACMSSTNDFEDDSDSE